MSDYEYIPEELLNEMDVLATKYDTSQNNPVSIKCFIHFTDGQYLLRSYKTNYLNLEVSNTYVKEFLPISFYTEQELRSFFVSIKTVQHFEEVFSNLETFIQNNKRYKYTGSSKRNRNRPRHIRMLLLK